MAVRSLIQIDVDDGRFKAFQALYERYEAALAKAPGKWAEINKQIDSGGKTFQALTAAILAQTETLSNIITQQKGVTYEVEKQARAWQGVAKWARGVAGDIESATKFMLKWSPIVTGVLGLGGLYGIDRMAEGVSAGRRSSLGLGTTYGEQKAFGANFSRLVDPEGFLTGVAGAKLDVRQRRGLLASGLTQQDLAGDTAQTGVALLGQLKRIADTTNPQLYGNVIEARHLGNFVSPQDLQRLRNTSPQEFQQLVAGYGRDRGGFDLPADTQKAWQDLATQLTRAAVGIENTFVKGLTPLAPAIERVSIAFADLAKAALANPKLGEWIDTVARGFEHLAELVSGQKSVKDVVNSRVAGAIVGAGAGFLVGGPLGAAGGALIGYGVGSMAAPNELPAMAVGTGIPIPRVKPYSNYLGRTGSSPDDMASETNSGWIGREGSGVKNSIAAYLQQRSAPTEMTHVVKVVPGDDKYWSSPKPSVTIYNEAGSGIFASVNGLKN